jgi:hypothetical protein
MNDKQATNLVVDELKKRVDRVIAKEKEIEERERRVAYREKNVAKRERIILGHTND